MPGKHCSRPTSSLHTAALPREDALSCVGRDALQFLFCETHLLCAIWAAWMVPGVGAALTKPAA